MSPSSGYRIRQSSFHPRTQIFIPMSIGSLDAVYTAAHPSFLDIFTYRLLKADFDIHPYGRTIFSLMRGSPAHSALISA